MRSLSDFVLAKIGPMFDSQNTNMMNSDISSHFSLAFAFFSTTFYLYLAANCAIVLPFAVGKFLASNAFLRMKSRVKKLLCR